MQNQVCAYEEDHGLASAKVSDASPSLAIRQRSTFRSVRNDDPCVKTAVIMRLEARHAKAFKPSFRTPQHSCVHGYTDLLSQLLYLKPVMPKQADNRLLHRQI